MTHSTISHILAAAVLIGGVIVVIIDVGTEFQQKWAIKMKWSLCWTCLRYLVVVCGVLLALDVYF